MHLPAAFRRCLDEADPAALRALWAKASPHLPPIGDDARALIVIHRARTEARSLRLEKRLYSHAWLEERGLPSNLPDDLRPPGERVGPVIAAAVGVAVMPRRSTKEHIERAREMESAMAAAAAEAMAEGVTDSAVISARMWEAKARLELV